MLNVEHIISLVEKSGYSLSSAEKSLGFGNGSIKRWKQSIPSIDKLYVLSKFLNISIYELLGEEIPSSKELTADQQDLLKLYETLTEVQQAEIKGYMKGLAANR